MMKSTFLTFGVLAIFGLASVSAGLVDWFGDDGEDEILDRDRRQAGNACSIKKVAEAAKCSGVVDAYTADELSASVCGKAAKVKRDATPAPKKKSKKSSKSAQPCSKCLLESKNIIANGAFNAAAYASAIGVSATDATFAKNLAECNAALSGATENAKVCGSNVAVRTHNCMLLKRVQAQAASAPAACDIASLQTCDASFSKQAKGAHKARTVAAAAGDVPAPSASGDAAAAAAAGAAQPKSKKSSRKSVKKVKTSQE